MASGMVQHNSGEARASVCELMAVHRACLDNGAWLAPPFPATAGRLHQRRATRRRSEEDAAHKGLGGHVCALGPGGHARMISNGPAFSGFFLLGCMADQPNRPLCSLQQRDGHGAERLRLRLCRQTAAQTQRSGPVGECWPIVR